MSLTPSVVTVTFLFLQQNRDSCEAGCTVYKEDVLGSTGMLLTRREGGREERERERKVGKTGEYTIKITKGYSLESSS